MVVYSENETKHFGLKVGRYNTDSIDPDLLKTEFHRNDYDLVRVRTNINDEFAVSKLFETGIPFYFSGGIRRYKVNVWDAPLPPLINPKTDFELFESNDQHLAAFNDILKDTWGGYPLGYYRSPQLNNHIDKELEHKTLFNYYASNYDNTMHPDKYLWLMKQEQEVIGFIALNIIQGEKSVDSTIAGIAQQHQKSGHFIDVLRHIRYFCQAHQLDYFLCGARQENLRSQKAFESEYMKCYACEYIFHVVREGL